MNDIEKAQLKQTLSQHLSRLDAERTYNQTVMLAAKKPVNMGIIKSAVEYYFNFKDEELASQARTDDICLARHVAFYLCYTFTNASYPQIGKVFGNRDHTTVMYGVKRIYASKQLSAIAADIAGMVRGEATLEKVTKWRLRELMGMEGVNYAA